MRTQYPPDFAIFVSDELKRDLHDPPYCTVVWDHRLGAGASCLSCCRVIKHLVIYVIIWPSYSTVQHRMYANVRMKMQPIAHVSRSIGACTDTQTRRSCIE